MVRLYRTFSINKVCRVLCTSSGWFKHIEPHRTFSNHIITEIARCVEFCHMSSGWFDCTEPSLSTSLQGKQSVQGAYALVRGGSSTSNLVKPSRTTSLPYRTFSIHIVTGEMNSTEVQNPRRHSYTQTMDVCITPRIESSQLTPHHRSSICRVSAPGVHRMHTSMHAQPVSCYFC